jgi:hypothetical protein
MRVYQIDVEDWDSVEILYKDQLQMVIYWDRTRQAITQMICGKLALQAHNSRGYRPGETITFDYDEPAIARALREEGL